MTADATGSYPTAVTDAFGHALQFAYTQNASGHQLLHSVTDPAGGSITYAYDAQDNPTGVTYQDTASRHYAYTAYTVPLLTQLTDESSTAAVRRGSVRINGTPESSGVYRREE